MKRIITILIITILAAIVSSCSHRIAEYERAEIINGRVSTSPMTKGGVLSGKVTPEIIHKAQTNHVAILIHGIVFHDGVFVQTLSEKDMLEIGITEEEYAFAQDYLKELNKTLKQ